jgi:hypothetical protein
VFRIAASPEDRPYRTGDFPTLDLGRRNPIFDFVMEGTISFHPVRVDWFDRLIEPLIGGETVNPEVFLEAALRFRGNASHASTVKLALESILDEVAPPPPPADGTFWEKLKARLEMFDHKVGPLARLAERCVEPELHLRGRPFFITEGSATRVAEVVDDYLDASDGPSVEALVREQLIKLARDLGEQVELDEAHGLDSNMTYRADLLRALTQLSELAQAARRGERWSSSAQTREPAMDVLLRELPYRAVHLHSRAVPFWIAENVDGLETVCGAAGVAPPAVLVSARQLFARTCDEFSDLGESMHGELEQAHGVGAYVAPGDVAELVDFLASQGGRIIQAATRHGVGGVCENVLRKIRECAAYAQRHEMGYLEASGIRPVFERPE